MRNLLRKSVGVIMLVISGLLLGTCIDALIGRFFPGTTGFFLPSIIKPFIHEAILLSVLVVLFFILGSCFWNSEKTKMISGIIFMAVGGFIVIRSLVTFLFLGTGELDSQIIQKLFIVRLSLGTIASVCGIVLIILQKKVDYWTKEFQHISD